MTRIRVRENVPAARGSATTGGARRAWALLFLLTALWGAGKAAAAEQSFPLEIQAIKERGVLRVALPSEDLPYYYYSASPGGALEGHEIDLARSLADDLGVDLEFDRKADTYDELVTRVREEKADVGICVLSKTTSRSQQVLMSRPYLLVHPTVVVNRLQLAQFGGKTTGLEGLRRPGVKIAAQMGTSYVGYAELDFPQAEIVPIDSLKGCWDAVRQGDVFAFYYDEIEIKSQFKRNPRLKIPLEIVAIEDVNDYIGIAVPPNHWSLLHYVNTYLDLNRPRILLPDEVMQKYRDPSLPAAEATGPQVGGTGRPSRWLVVAAAALFLGILFLLKRRRRPAGQPAPSGLAKTLGAALLSPLAVLAGVVAGAIIGIYFRPLAGTIRPVGVLYMSLLQMCVLPVIMVTVVNSLGLLLHEGGVKRVLTRCVAFTALGALLISSFGALGTAATGIGSNLNAESTDVLGEFLSKNEEQFKKPSIAAGEGQGLWDLADKVVPENIFSDLGAGNTLSVLFFSAILGIALGVTDRSRSEIFSVLESLYKALSRIIEWLMYGLPVGMCCLIASMFAAVGVDILLGATQYIVFVYSGIGAVMLVSSLVIWRRSGHSYAESFSALRRPLLIGLGNGRPVSAIPQAIDGLKELGFDARSTSLVVPLTFSAISLGSILHFATSAVFLAHLYGAPLGPQEYVIVIFASVLAGIAAANSPGVIALSMIGIVLVLLKLPLAPSLALLYALDPLLDQPLALASVYGNCACTALVAEPTHRPAAPVATVIAASEAT